MLNHRLARLFTSTAAIAVVAFATPVSAQSPQAPVVAAGSVSVTRQGAVTVVTQSTDKGAIDWRSFSVGPQETVRFDQPGRSSITLNRVTGSEISRIDGSILSNGQVWLSNPNGVLIGPSGQVNVGSLLATTGRIDAAEFMRSGRARIDQIGKDAAIVNGGTINVAAGGYAALAAASIRNEGVVAARAGTVAMGAGKAVTVDFVGDKLLQFQVSQPLDQAPSGVDSAGSDAAIVSSGTIAAQGGTVLLSARAAKGVMDNVVNLKGHVIANSVTVDGGTVHLGDGGTVQVSARIDASSATDKGGAVAVLGEKVGLMDGAVIDASGATGGGTVLIGGDWQGKGELGATGRNAQVAYVAPTASINVDATQRGDGGTAVAWADDTTRFNGSISAQGGLLGGDGGKVETSGKRALAVGPIASVTTNARAAQAKAGAWLLDPNNIAIAVGGETNITGAQTFTAATDAASTINVSTIQSALATGSVVVQTTTGNSSGAGDISWASGAVVSYAGANSLTLKADRDITMAGTINFTGTGAVTLNSRSAGGSLGAILVSGSITTTGGSISLAGGLAASSVAIGGGGLNVGVAITGLVESGGGSIYINGRGSSSSTGLLVSGTLKSSGGAMSIFGAAGSTGAVGVSVSGLIDGGAGDVSITGTGGSGVISSAHGIGLTAGGKITTTNGNITASGTGNSGLSNSTHGINLTGGTISATGTGSIRLTGVRGGGGPSNNLSLSTSALISTNSGNLTIVGTATSGGGTAIQNGGLVMESGATITTVNGAITVSGSGAPTASSSGILLGNGTAATISATGSGNVTLNFLAGGSGGYGMLLSSQGTIAIGSGNAVINVDSYTGSSVINGGTGTIRMQPPSAATAIGLAAGAGTIFFDQMINMVTGTPSSVIVGRSDMTALLTVGASGYVLTRNLTLQTGSGGIVLLGPINSNTAGNRSLKLQTATGTVSYGATIGMTTALAALDISAALTTTLGAGNPVFGTTGSQSYAGAFRFVGNGANTAATFSTTGGDIIFANTIDSSATGAEQGLLFAAGTGKVSLAGAIGNTTSMRSINSSGSGSVTVNGLLRSSSTQSYAGAVIVESTSIIRATSSNVIFAGAVNGPGDLTVDTVSGAATAAFAGQVGSTTALGSFTRTGGTSAATYFTNAVNTIKTTGTQSYTGPVIFANSAVALSTVNSAVTFSQAVDSLDNGANIGGLTIAAGTGGVTFGNNVGVGTALTTLASTGTGAVRLGGTYRTTGTQSYAGSLSFAAATTLSASNVTIMAGGGGGSNFTVAGPATIAGTITNTGAQSYGGALLLTAASTFRAGTNLTFAGAIDAQSAGTAVTTTVTGAGGSLIFNGPVGATTPLGATQINVNNAPINLPTFKSSSLVLTTNGGTIGQTGAITLSSTGIFNTNGGDINLNTQANDFTSLNVTAGPGSAAFQDAVGNLTLSTTSVNGTLTITSNSGATVNQSSPISVGGLLLLGSGATYQLTNASNVIGSVAGNTGAGGIQVVSTGNLSVANIFGTNGITTTGTLRLSATNTSNLLVNAPVSAGPTFLTAAGSISGTSAVTASALTVSSNGGSLNNVVVNSQTAAAAAALVSVTAGGISINGVSLGATTATTATTASVATVPSVASVTTVVSTPSVATVATVASVPTLAPTIASVATVVSAATVATTPSVPNVEATPDVRRLLLSGGVDLIAQIITTILPIIPRVNFDLAPTTPVAATSSQPGSVNAADAFRSVSNTPSGAFIPMSPPSVQGTGAPLASAQTIKVDPADAGGANGQVIAGGGSGGGSTTIVPGLLTERRAGAARGLGGTEPPLAQQPSQMNEEPMLD